MAIRKSARRLATALGVLPVAFACYKAARELRPAMVLRNRKLRREEARRGVPVPPASLMYLATTSRDVTWFLQGGRRSADAIVGALAQVGRPIESFRSVLDFGCGCGRVLRQWIGLEGPKFTGTDYNPKGPAWVAENLSRFATATNTLAPPLPFESASFDLVYSISVFTHLPRALQHPWIDEMHRVLEPGGILVVTLLGSAFATTRLSASDMESFEGGELVVRDADFAGSNLCAAYHPAEWVYVHFAPRFRILLHLPDGAGGSGQDLWVLERLP